MSTPKFQIMYGSFAAGAGKSAYDIAVEHGFEGTEQEWLESLKGDDNELCGELHECATPCNNK